MMVEPQFLQILFFGTFVTLACAGRRRVRMPSQRRKFRLGHGSLEFGLLDNSINSGIMLLCPISQTPWLGDPRVNIQNDKGQDVSGQTGIKGN